MSSETNYSVSSLPHEEISARAHRLWENAGSPADRDLEFWLEAESNLRREHSNVPRTTAREAGEPIAKRTVNRRR